MQGPIASSEILLAVKQGTNVLDRKELLSEREDPFQTATAVPLVEL